MADLKTADTSGRDHYDKIYREELELENRWLEYGAIDKADSVEALLRKQNIHPRTLLELGCGTGALISECRRRGIADRYVAVDYSKDAIAYLTENSPGIEAHVADLMEPPAPILEQFDLIVLSHVLEHLEHPDAMLQIIISRFRFKWLFIEVPLEDLPFSRIKNLFRDRLRNPAGHVQFFNGGTFRRLISRHGIVPVVTRRYAPVMTPEIIEFLGEKDRTSRLRTLLRKITGRFLPRYFNPIWKYIYYSNIAVLCRQAQSNRD
jgi:SAM-dependent methyltransferase